MMAKVERIPPAKTQQSLANIKPRLLPIFAIINEAGMLTSIVAINITAMGSVANDLSIERACPTSAEHVTINETTLTIKP